MAKDTNIQTYFIVGDGGNDEVVVYGTNSLKGFTQEAAYKKCRIYRALSKDTSLRVIPAMSIRSLES